MKELIKNTSHYVINKYGLQNDFSVYRLIEFLDGSRKLLESNINYLSDLRPESLSKKFGDLKTRENIVMDRLMSENFDWIQESTGHFNPEAMIQSSWSTLATTEDMIDYHMNKVLENQPTNTIQEFIEQTNLELNNKSKKIIDQFDQESISVPKGLLEWLLQNEFYLQSDEEFGNPVNANVVKLVLSDPKFANLNVEIND